MAELEKELGLALEEEQVKLPYTGTLASPSPCLVETAQARSRVKKAQKLLVADQKSCRMFLGMAQLKAWEQRESEVVVVEGEA